MDQIRDLGWLGVVGNTDEMLFRPKPLQEFASQSPKLQPLFAAIEEMAIAAREALGEARLAWLRALPLVQMQGPMALVHGSPDSPWRAPAHIHRAYIRSVSGMTVANTGSVSLSYDGDRRAAYILLDDFKPVIRPVEYDLERELEALSGCRLPHADWVAKMLDSGCFQMP